jgi:hypothetical protein
MWETFNSTWLEARANAPTRFTARNVAEFVEWVKYRAHLARGVVLGSMLRDEGYHFMQIGTFLERADGVARLLQVRLACETTDGTGELVAHDYLPWSVLLRALSAYEIFRRVSRGRVTPTHVFEFAAFRPDVPRSLLRSAELVYENVRNVANAQSGRNREARGCAAFAAALRNARNGRHARHRVFPDRCAGTHCGHQRSHRPRLFSGTRPPEQGAHGYTHATADSSRDPLRIRGAGQLQHPVPAPDAAAGSRPARAVLAHHVAG